jgi:formylglycine-generating enzyme required for sulfatase activity
VFKNISLLIFTFCFLAAGCINSKPEYFPPISFEEQPPLFPTSVNYADPKIKNNNNFRIIKKGYFKMGSPLSEVGRNSDEIIHGVVISKDFEMQTTPVTQAQYFLVMRTNPVFHVSKSQCPEEFIEIDSIAVCPNDPVTKVSWTEVQEFIKKLNSNSTKLYRLPTEAEWEWAARAESDKSYFFGDDVNELERYASFSKNSNNLPSRVASKLPNKWGLYDMIGNVNQWVSDGYNEYPTEPQTDPVGSLTYEAKVLRGGSYSDSAEFLRSASRSALHLDSHESNVGFRLVREIP